MKYLKTLCLIGVLFFWSGCNNDDTDPGGFNLQDLMTTAQIRTANAVSGDAAIAAGIFSQYFFGNSGTPQSLEKYAITDPALMNSLWVEFYASVMISHFTMIEKATQENSPHYAGVAKVLMAFSLGTATSLWGDIPYSEAFQGTDLLSPKYDSQQSLYANIQKLLDEAIVDLGATSSKQSPGPFDDAIFNGDLSRWIRVAHTLKARYYLHLTKRDNGAASKALTALVSGINSNSGDLQFPYGNGQNNPWFTYLQNSANILVDDQFHSLIIDDPREFFMIKMSSGEVQLGPFFNADDAPLLMATYYETKFLEAEALLRTNDFDGAELALKEAIREHINKVTENSLSQDDVNAFAEEKGSLTGNFEQDLGIILTQKHIAVFPQTEGWTDFRRSNLPSLLPNPDGDNVDNPGGEIPRRFLYSLDEVTFNDNTPSPLPNLQDRFWWDE